MARAINPSALVDAFGLLLKSISEDVVNYINHARSIRPLKGDVARTTEEKLNQYATLLKALSTTASALEERVKQIKLQKDDLESNIIPKLMERAEIEKVSFQGLGTLYLRTEPKCSVLVEDKPKFFAWLKENGHEDILKEDVHHQTLNSWAKEILEAGSPVPEYVKVFMQTKAVIRSK